MCEKAALHLGALNVELSHYIVTLLISSCETHNLIPEFHLINTSKCHDKMEVIWHWEVIFSPIPTRAIMYCSL